MQNYQTRDRIYYFLSVYIVIDCLMKWVAMYYPFRNGVVAAVILFVYLITILLYHRFKLSFNKKDRLVWLYFIYNTVLIAPTVIKGYPTSIIVSEISATLMPILVLFIAKRMKEKHADQFETVFWGVCLLLLVTGLYYNITLNDPYYIKFLQANFNGFAMWWFSKTPRLCSFYGAVVCGTFGCVCMCLSFRRYTSLNKFSFWTRFFTGFALAILSLQRSAMLCAVLFTIFTFVYLRIKGVIGSKGIISFVLISITIVSVFFFLFPQVIEAVLSRYDAFNTAIAERSEGWENAFSNGTLATIFGAGFGTGGQRAIGYSSSTVNDGNYYKIIYDIGIVGLLVFLAISFSFLRQGFRNGKGIYSIVILSYFVQMIGSNILTFGSTALLFWYVLGRIDSCENIVIDRNTQRESI